jgi:hypothetical protein
MTLEDYIKIVNKMSVEEQKKLVFAKRNEGLFDNNMGVFYGMLKRLEKGKKLTSSQIIWLYYASQRQSKLSSFISKKDLEAFL